MLEMGLAIFEIDAHITRTKWISVLLFFQNILSFAHSAQLSHSLYLRLPVDSFYENTILIIYA